MVILIIIIIYIYIYKNEYGNYPNKKNATRARRRRDERWCNTSWGMARTKYNPRVSFITKCSRAVS